VIDVRLIDADALIDDLKHDVALDQDSLDYEELTDSNRKIIQFDKDCKQNAIDLLQNAPTIEPERKNGKWIPQDHNKTNGMASTLVYYYPKCSVCGYCDNYTNFCPNCGADMRGEEDNIPIEYFESGGK
jgi:hypothetical protein